MTTYRKKDHLRIEPVADRYLVFDLNRYHPHALNDIAADILRNSDGRTPLKTIAERIYKKYDADYDRVLKDIENIYEDFIQNELVEQVEGIMEPTGKVYCVHPDIVFREEDDGAFLFNPENDTLRCVNTVGATVCKLCNGENDLENIYRSITESFDVDIPAETLRADVRQFIDQMLALNLLQECT